MGAHSHLKEYMSPTQASMPMVARSMCAVRSHADKVENTRKNGRPAENPEEQHREHGPLHDRRRTPGPSVTPFA